MISLICRILKSQTIKKAENKMVVNRGWLGRGIRLMVFKGYKLEMTSK